MFSQFISGVDRLRFCLCLCSMCWFQYLLRFLFSIGFLNLFEVSRLQKQLWLNLWMVMKLIVYWLIVFGFIVLQFLVVKNVGYFMLLVLLVLYGGIMVVSVLYGYVFSVWEKQFSELMLVLSIGLVLVLYLGGQIICIVIFGLLGFLYVLFSVLQFLVVIQVKLCMLFCMKWQVVLLFLFCGWFCSLFIVLMVQFDGIVSLMLYRLKFVQNLLLKWNLWQFQCILVVLCLFGSFSMLIFGNYWLIRLKLLNQLVCFIICGSWLRKLIFSVSVLFVGIGWARLMCIMLWLVVGLWFGCMKLYFRLVLVWCMLLRLIQFY